MDLITGLMVVAVLVTVITVSVLIYKLNSTNTELKLKNLNLSMDNKTLEEVAKGTTDKFDELMYQYTEVKDKLDKTVHQKKSSEVKLGKIGENLAPFTEGWPWEPNDFRFLGSPIDGIQFTEDRIYLVEIKTGKARLSKKQILCRNLVKEGKISFVSYRIDAEGHTLLEVPALSE